MLIEGARRVGKSYIAKKFAQNEYQSYILIDFSNVSPEITNLFECETHDLSLFFMKLSVFYNTKLYERNSLIIFDEVQLYPRARQLIKHFVADGRYDFLETGSLLSLKTNIQDILLPSEERSIEMYSLDFEEFLIALDENMLFEYIKDCYINKKALGESIHRKALNLFRQYMIVGGMPQVVLEYLQTKDFSNIDKIKRQILTLYRNDISKFAQGYKSKVISVFDEIPNQLSKHEKKFVLSNLDANARYRSYEDSFIWLSEAKITNNCFNASEPNIGLKLNENRLSLKCYMADTGLFLSHALEDKNYTENEIYKSLLFGHLSVNEGMFMENIVAQMLVNSGHKLFFYSRYDNKDSNNRMEIDFLIRQGKKIHLVEVKSSAYKKHSSINKFVSKFKQNIGSAYIIYTKDLNIEENIIYLPIYMTIFL